MRKGAKAHVFKEGRVWAYVVSDGEKVVFTDRTCNWRLIFNDAFVRATAVREVLRAGHRFQHSYADLVEMESAR